MDTSAFALCATARQGFKFPLPAKREKNAVLYSRAGYKSVGFLYTFPSNGPNLMEVIYDQ